MQTQLKIIPSPAPMRAFDFRANPIRVLGTPDEPLFVVKDVCDVLEIGNVTEATRNLEKDELTSVVLKSGGQNREMLAVDESGLYVLIFQSRKEEAKAFRRWVTREVLPSIRKTGFYGVRRQEQTALDICAFWQAGQIGLTDAIDAALVLLVEKHLIEKGTFRGSFSEMLDWMNCAAPSALSSNPNWPTTWRQLRFRLERNEWALIRLGIGVYQHITRSVRVLILWFLEKIEETKAAFLGLRREPNQLAA